MVKRVRAGFGATVVVISIALAGVSCGRVAMDGGPAGAAVTREALVGDWVEPAPGLEGEVQGFSLHEDGTASSINMATLLYRRWRLDNGKLVLTGESIGNRTSSLFDEAYRVHSVSTGRLELIDDQGRTQIFARPAL